MVQLYSLWDNPPIKYSDYLKKKGSVYTMDIIEKITASQIRHDLPEFRVGDTVRVDINIVEGKRERIQSYEGIVIAIKGSGVSKTFTVRKLSAGIGVEKTFPYNMPTIKGVTVVRKGMVRRAKLNYLRDLKSQPKIKERRDKTAA